MNMHKNTRLTPYHREEIWRLYTKEKVTVTSLAQRFNVSLPTIYNALKLARLRLFKPQTSTNERFKTIQYGIKRLVKVEKAIEDRLKREAKRYNKSYPGEMVHVDTKRLPCSKVCLKQSAESIYLWASMIFQGSFMQGFMMTNPNSVRPHFFSRIFSARSSWLTCLRRK